MPEAKPGPNYGSVKALAKDIGRHWKQQSEDVDLTLEEETNKLDQDGPGIGMENLMFCVREFTVQAAKIATQQPQLLLSSSHVVYCLNLRHGYEI